MEDKPMTVKRLISLCFTLILLTLCAAPAAMAYTFDSYYIIPDSDTRVLTESELWQYSRETLRYIRNEILARNGYAFSQEKFYSFFNAKPWYRAGGYETNNKLNAVEWDNISIVKKVEKDMDKSKTENKNGVMIEDIINYQNYMGGYGNQINHGNPRGNGSGQVIGTTSSQYPSTVRPVTPQPNYIYNSQYIIPDSNTRRLTERELWGYTREALRYIRNELLARHGYIFGDNKFGRYFKTKDWYHSGGYENAILSNLEWDNIDLIRKVERDMDILKTSNDTGLDITTIIYHQNNGTYPGYNY